MDVLFTDINMPVMTGAELLREIAANERWRSLRRVIISTDGSAARRDEAAASTSAAIWKNRSARR